MNIGEEGDTRKFRRLRHTDYYDAKSAVEADKRRKPVIKPCVLCGELVTGLSTNGYCLRCTLETL
jgi:hypothetical protein